MGIRKVWQNLLEYLYLTPTIFTIALVLQIALVKNFSPITQTRSLQGYYPIYYNVFFIFVITLFVFIYLLIAKKEKYKIIVALVPFWLSLVLLIAMVIKLVISLEL